MFPRFQQFIDGFLDCVVKSNYIDTMLLNRCLLGITLATESGEKGGLAFCAHPFYQAVHLKLLMERTLNLWFELLNRESATALLSVDPRPSAILLATAPSGSIAPMFTNILPPAFSSPGRLWKIVESLFVFGGIDAKTVVEVTKRHFSKLGN